MADGAYNDTDRLSNPYMVKDGWNDLEFTYNDLASYYSNLTMSPARPTLLSTYWTDILLPAVP